MLFSFRSVSSFLTDWRTWKRFKSCDNTVRIIVNTRFSALFSTFFPLLLRTLPLYSVGPSNKSPHIRCAKLAALLFAISFSWPFFSTHLAHKTNESKTEQKWKGRGVWSRTFQFGCLSRRPLQSLEFQNRISDVKRFLVGGKINGNSFTWALRFEDWS